MNKISLESHPLNGINLEPNQLTPTKTLIKLKSLKMTMIYATQS